MSTDTTKDVETTVIAVLTPAFEQAVVRTADGFQYTILKRTPGIAFADLREGQKVICTVYTQRPIVKSTRLPDSTP